MISEGNDPTPSLLFSQSASRFCTLRAGGGRAGGRDRQVTPGPCPAVAFPARVLPLRRCVAGGPPRTAEVGTWPGSWGANPGTRNLSIADAPRRRSGAGSPETGPERPSSPAETQRWPWPARRRRRAARRRLRLPGHGRATPAARILDRKAPSDH